MADLRGTLHIFRRSVVNGGTHYQVNFTVPGTTWARVLDSEEALDHFLSVEMALASDVVDSIWSNLDGSGNTVLRDVGFRESDTAPFGMTRAPSDM